MFRWYVVNTYSGHENKVKHNLEHRVVSLGQQRAVRSVVVPTETVMEMKDNQKNPVEKRTMPGYVLVNMELNEDSWGVVKGTPGVTGFVGASQEPVALTQGEVDRLLHKEVATATRARAACKRSKARVNSSCISAIFKPKVIGSAWMPWVRPTITVCLNSCARLFRTA